MKKQKKRAICLWIVSILIILYGCNKDPEFEQDVIRPLPRLITPDILPPGQPIHQVKHGEIPFAHSMFADNFIAEYEFRWEGNGFIYIDGYVCESGETARNYLQEMHRWYTNPFIEDHKDQPAVAGNISYSGGKEFIRDNIIIKIFASDEFNGQLTPIARRVDECILRGPEFSTSQEVKPIINAFEISQDPIAKVSDTELTIDISDPNDRSILLNWRYGPDAKHGTVEEREPGHFMYISNCPNLMISEVELTMIATNSFGFTSHSTISISVE